MDKNTKRHSNSFARYLLIGTGILAIMAAGIVLFNRNPAIAGDAKEIEGSVVKSSDELLSSSSNGLSVEKPDSGSESQSVYQVADGGNLSGIPSQTPVSEEIPTVIVAEVDLSTRPQQEQDNETVQSEEFQAELEGEDEARVGDFEGNDRDADSLTEAGTAHSREAQNEENPSDKGQSDTRAESESVKTGSEEESGHGTQSEKESRKDSQADDPIAEKDPETSGNRESGEQETGKPAEPSTETSGEPVTESSAEEEVRESVEGSTESVTVTVAESASESTTAPPVREMKKLVLGEESVTVPLESPESIGDLNKLTGTERYELSLQFDSVSAYNEYIAFLKKADDMQRIEAGKNPGI